MQGLYDYAEGGTRTRMPRGATPSRWCVCQFHHFGEVFISFPVSLAEPERSAAAAVVVPAPVAAVAAAPAVVVAVAAVAAAPAVVAVAAGRAPAVAAAADSVAGRLR